MRFPEPGQLPTVVAKESSKPPVKSDLDIIMASQVKQKDEAGAEKTLETLVATYNTQEDWDQISSIALTTKGMRDIDYVYMGRLIVLQAGKVKSSDATPPFRSPSFLTDFPVLADQTSGRMVRSGMTFDICASAV